MGFSGHAERQIMSYTFIPKPPENIGDYVTVPRNDIPEEFEEALIGLLRQDVFHITTDGVPLVWVTDAVIEAAKGYRITAKQIPVNWGELGTAHAIFYFERLPSN